MISDSNYVKCAAPRLDPQKTVFVGALHGMMTAQGLAMIFQVHTISLYFWVHATVKLDTLSQDLFGGVVYAGLDTDKYKYPIGD